MYKVSYSILQNFEDTPKEIADVLELKEQSIYKRLKRGKKMLQDNL